MSLLNGVDLEGLHELGREFRQEPWEAQLGLGVEATPDGPDRCLISTGPVRLGTTRAARPFVFPHGTGSPAAAGLRDPLASVLAALGAGVASEVATALTGHRVSPSRLEVRTQAQLPTGGGTLDPRSDLTVEVRIDGDVDEETALQCVAAARTRSTVLRTLEEANEIRAVLVAEENRYLTDRPHEYRADTEKPGGARRSASAVWESGLLVVAEVDGVTVQTDQPKQLFGGDRAPSPEEHLLAALAAEALGHATRPGGSDHGASIHASARLDLRGPDSSEGVPVGLGSLLVQFLPGVGADVRAEAVDAWLTDGDVLRLVRDNHPVKVRLVLNGDSVGV
ncbi:OsmC family protein [Streptacidiphilus jiangxiensis]|uniref:OsmC-like protein n=1 Tax=Streptacidiphilus jiangxiensis TaxID=235985 RepID=A0A1H7Y5E0_STRJI|nr:OsmC family protein [Streptacidiphilus jiangxiensis]SEM40557.1 OsmC-like protein [Streptacidiphilus jiangxiensis]